MEKDGDSMIREWVEYALNVFFGEGNHRIRRIVIDHANSNSLFKQASIYYNLNQFGHSLPDPDRFPDSFLKAVADLFEAWIGFCILSRRLFDNEAPLTDLREFFGDFLSLRYNDLRQYTCSVFASRFDIPDDLRCRMGKLHQKEVRAGDIQPVMPSVPPDPKILLGFLLSVEVKPPPSSKDDEVQTLTTFATNIEDVKKIRKLLIWHHQRQPPSLL